MIKVVEDLKHVRRIVLTDYMDGVKMLDLARSLTDASSDADGSPGSGQGAEAP